MQREEGKKRYWSRWRQLAVIVWLASLFAVPLALEQLGLISLSVGFIPFSLVLVAGVGVFLDRLALRVGIALVIIFGIGTVYRPDAVSIVLEGLNFRMQDAFFKMRGPRKPTGQVVIADIDERSLKEVGQWPWPRTEIAKAVDVMAADGARVIGFDVVFAEKDRLSLQDWAQRLQTMGVSVSVTEQVAAAADSLPLAAVQPGVEALSDYSVPPDGIRRIVLADWERRLSKLDPSFFVEPSLSEAEKEALITERYIAYRKEWWEEEEKTNVSRLQRVGIDYEARAYTPPARPLLEMSQTSRELFYIQERIADGSILDRDGKLVLDNDAELGRALREARSVAGGLFITETSAGAKMSFYRKYESHRQTQGMVVSKGIQGDVVHVLPGIRHALKQVVNVPELQQQVFHQAMFNIVPDQSGAARYYTMIMNAPVFQESLVLKPEKANLGGAALLNPDNYDTRIISQQYTYPSLALEMLRTANGYDDVEVGYLDETRGLFLRRSRGFRYPGCENDDSCTVEQFPELLPDQNFIPLDFKGDLLINFCGFGGRWQPEFTYGPDYYFPYYSLADIVQGNLPPGTFKDKYVLIGSTDPTLSDLVGSPFRPAFPGLEVHATMLDNLINGDYIVDFGQWTILYTFLGVLIGGAVLSIIIAYTAAWIAAASTVAVLTALPALGYYGIAQGGFVFNFVYPWLAVAVASAVVTFVNFFVEGRERRFVANQFSKMVSPDVLHKLRDDPAGVSLAGQRAVVSVQFSDVVGFTTISEALSPKRLVALLNDYFTPMADIILGNDGFIDKFMGDAIMAVWGVPFADNGHSRKACLSALQQRKKLQEISAALDKEYGCIIQVRLGIATGEVSAALMGSENRKSYTVMGDTVNLGARLEPACKDYGCDILICQQTYDEVKEEFVARCVDKLVVKGKTVPVPVYELMGLREEATDSQLKLVTLFDQAMDQYWNQQWDEVLVTLDRVLEIDPDDQPAQKLQLRVNEFKLAPPPEDWDGSFVKTTK